MNILVVGCGRVGANLVRQLDEAGHDVSVLDDEVDSLKRLSEFDDYSFTGVAVIGVPIDVDVLRQAGVETCDAVAAVTDNDNINIMVSQIARDIFHVKQVVTRVADPTRNRTFSEQFDLNTVCPTDLTVQATLTKLTQGGTAQ